jgi:hypothetical protein
MVPLTQHKHTCMFFTDKQKLSPVSDNINNKAAKTPLSYWADYVNMTLTEYKSLRLSMQNKTRKLKKRVARVLNFKLRLKSTYDWRKSCLKSELERVKLFKSRNRGWQHIDHRPEKAILDNLAELYDDMRFTTYKKRRDYKKRRHDRFRPTNIKLYYRQQRKTYFMHHIGRIISDAEYQEIHLRFKRYLPIDDIYEDAIRASIFAVGERQRLENMPKDQGKRAKRRSAAVIDRKFDRRIYLPARHA